MFFIGVILFFILLFINPIGAFIVLGLGVAYILLVGLGEIIRGIKSLFSKE